jgi:hypothetical protein
MWSDPQKRQCYGNMFPNVSLVEANKAHRGEVFGCRLNSFGIGTQSVEFTVDEAKWEHCTECPHYRTCYDLSVAKLAFENAVGRN